MLQLYDTRTRQVEPIEPTRRGALRIYTCGPTVYRPAHVGNLRSYLLADLIRRTAAAARIPVVSCLNITDVGHLADDSEADPAGPDKVLTQARTEGISPRELARRHEAAFRADCAALNIYPADHSPRASDSIQLMIELIGQLLRAGHAYQAPGGSVYFDARSYPGYGQLSGNRLADLRPGHRSGGEVEPGKRFHVDWALWKAAPAGRELTWDAPWGTGFPGWHIECSAMSLHFLGERIDVHTGGIDLRFPHHEDERAQSDCVTGHEVVRHWVHGEHLLFEGRKMAKAARNVVLLGDLPARGLDPLALRLAFLEHRYRQQVNLSWAGLRAADATLGRWRQQVAEWARSPSQALGGAAREFIAALEADLDTPAALRVLRRLERAGDVAPGAKFETFAYADQLLGLDLARDVGRDPAPTLPPGAAALLDARAAARAAADWTAADRLRGDLAALGVTVADTPDGQSWTLAAIPHPG